MEFFDKGNSYTVLGTVFTVQKAQPNVILDLLTSIQNV